MLGWIPTVEYMLCFLTDLLLQDSRRRSNNWMYLDSIEEVHPVDGHNLMVLLL